MKGIPAEVPFEAAPCVKALRVLATMKAGRGGPNANCL